MYTSLSISLKKGDIVDFDLGRPPLEVKGHEQGYKRPCVIVKSLTGLKLSIVIPLTSKRPKNPLFTIVKIGKETQGLTQDSYALCHQIRTISLDRFESKRGTLNHRDISKIDIALLDLLEL